jgi:hypothetical protein
MDSFSASLLDGQLRFGRFPSAGETRMLRGEGYATLVNLCDPVREGYLPEVDCDLHFPIPDRTPNVGSRGAFRQFTEGLVRKLRCGEKVYVFCRGGHGRSAMVAAILYFYASAAPITSQQALSDVFHAHQRRTEMKARWRKLGAPQTAAQKRCVRSYCVRL